MNNTEIIKKSLMKRHLAESRFKTYGILGIISATVFLIVIFLRRSFHRRRITKVEKLSLNINDKIDLIGWFYNKDSDKFKTIFDLDIKFNN